MCCQSRQKEIHEGSEINRGDSNAVVVGVFNVFAQKPAASSAPLDRTVLPIPEPKYPHITESMPAKPRLRRVSRSRRPPGPNVLIVLIDDMGFGQSSAFGGPIHMPTVGTPGQQRPALQQFSYHRALFSYAVGPVDGTQSPVNNFGSIIGDRHRVPRTDRRPPEQRRAAGGDVPAERLQHRRLRQVPRNRRRGRSVPPGPTDRWPTRSGFDKFYGFIGGETNQWAPLIYDGMIQVEVPQGSRTTTSRPT